MYLSAIDKRDRRQAAVDAQAALRHSKRRAYFDQRRHRESSLMYREPVFPEEAAVTLPVQEACRQASRKILFRPSWPNTVAIFSRYTPITDKDHLRMRVVGLAAYNGPVIDVFDLQTGELLYTADAHDRPIHCISVVSTATTQLPVFASCCHGGTIKLIELQTGKILEKVRCAVSGPCYGVCICDAKTSFLIAGCFNNVELWRIPSGRHQVSLEGHAGRVMCVLSHRSHPGHIDSNNPGFVASGDDLGYIRTWLLEDPWTPLLNIEAHEAAVLAMVLKKPMDNSDIDRYRLLTAGADKTFRVFDAMTGECLGRVSNHSGPIQALAVLRLNGPILSSGRPGKELRWKEDVVLTAGLDKRINFWRLNDMSLMYCMDRDKPVRGVAATCLPHPVIIATSMDEGIEILDLQLYDGIPPELRHWVDNHEEEDINKKDYDDEGDAR